MKLNRAHLGIGFLVLSLCLWIGFTYEAIEYFSLSNLQLQKDRIDFLYQERPFLVTMVFLCSYTIVILFVIPIATVFCLIVGAIYGPIYGTLLISFASTIGACLSFCLSRYFFRDYVETKYGDKLEQVQKGFVKDGAWYLFSLRLIPFFPYFLINLLFGLTHMKFFTFAWVSQLGMLLNNYLYVNAGVQFGKVTTLKDLISTNLIIAILMLAFFPLLTKKVIDKVRKA